MLLYVDLSFSVSCYSCFCYLQYSKMCYCHVYLCVCYFSFFYLSQCCSSPVQVVMVEWLSLVIALCAWLGLCNLYVEMYSTCIWSDTRVILCSISWSLVLISDICFRYIIDDDDEPTHSKPPLWKWVLRIIMLLLQLAPILRYLTSKILQLGSFVLYSSEDVFNLSSA
jgi:hypothetical protein